MSSKKGKGKESPGKNRSIVDMFRSRPAAGSKPKQPKPKPRKQSLCGKKEASPKSNPKPSPCLSPPALPAAENKEDVLASPSSSSREKGLKHSFDKKQRLPAQEQPVFVDEVVSMESVFQSWERGDAASREEAAALMKPTESVTFMVLDVTCRENTIFVYGCTSAGLGLRVAVEGFEPYLYLAVSPALAAEGVSAIRNKLNTTITAYTTKSATISASSKVKASKKRKLRVGDDGDEGEDESEGDGTSLSQGVDWVSRVEIVHQRRPLLFYRADTDVPEAYAKVFLRHPSVRLKAQRALRTAFFKDRASTMEKGFFHKDDNVYEANVGFVIRFMVDAGLSGGGWVSLSAPLTMASAPRSTCRSQVELTAQWQPGLFSAASIEDSCSIAPLRVLSFDVQPEEINFDLPSSIPSPSSPSSPNVKRRRTAKMKGSPDGKTGGGGAKNKGAGSAAVGKSRKEAESDYLYQAPFDSQRHFVSVLSCVAEWTGDGAKRPVQVVFAVNNMKPSSNTSLPTLVQQALSHAAGGLSKKSDGIAIHRHSDIHHARDYFLLVFANVVTGFEAATTDYPFLVERAKLHNIDLLDVSRDADRLAKCKSIQIYNAKWVASKKRQSATSTEAMGQVTLEGRIFVDSKRIVQQNHKLALYTLSETVQVVMNERPEQFIASHSLLKLLNRDSGDIAHASRALDYALRQAQLPLMLIKHLCTLPDIIELARVTGCLLQEIYGRGMMVRTWSLLLRRCLAEGVLVPSTRDGMSGGGLEVGPLVLDPTALGTAGLHEDPVAVVDYNSMYPSIMIAHNICYSTLVLSTYKNKGIGQKQAHVSPRTSEGNHWFVKTEVKRGILPGILTDLLSARRSVKQELAKLKARLASLSSLPSQSSSSSSTVSASGSFGEALPQSLEGLDEETRMEMAIQASLNPSSPSMLEVTKAELETRIMILDFRQKAIKVSANSLYGFTGALSSKVFVKALAESTLVWGAQKLEIAAQFFRKNCSNIEIVYGDTDSLMVKMPGRTVEEARETAKNLCAVFNATLPVPISIELEKVLCPFLLQQTKHYAGVNRKTGVLEVKGMETVRRDALPLLRKLMDGVLSDLLAGAGTRLQRVEAAKQRIRDSVGRLLKGECHHGELLITKAFARKGEYKVRTAHTEVCEKLLSRGKAVLSGARINYLFVQGISGAKQCELSEDPLYALRKQLPVNLKLYLTSLVEKPLVRLLCLPGVLGSVSNTTTFFKEFSRVVAKQTISSKVGMGRFFSVAPSPKKPTAAQPSKPSAKNGFKKASSKSAADLDRICFDCQGCGSDIVCGNTVCDVFWERRRLDPLYDDKMNSKLLEW